MNYKLLDDVVKDLRQFKTHFKTCETIKKSLWKQKKEAGLV